MPDLAFCYFTSAVKGQTEQIPKHLPHTIKTQRYNIRYNRRTDTSIKSTPDYHIIIQESFIFFYSLLCFIPLKVFHIFDLWFSCVFHYCRFLISAPVFPKAVTARCRKPTAFLPASYSCLPLARYFRLLLEWHLPIYSKLHCIEH